MQRINQQAVRLLAGVFVWPRHWLSWVVGVVTTAAMVLIVVPGDPVYVGNAAAPGDHQLDLPTEQETAWPRATLVAMGWLTPAPHLPYSVIEHSHGWPLEWLRRSNGYDGPNWPKHPTLSLFSPSDFEEPTWLYASAWPTASHASRLRLLPLFIDAVVFLLFVLAPTMAFEHWRRRRASWLQWRVIDLLVAATLVAALLGWWQRHARLAERESHAVAEVFPKEHLPSWGGGYLDHPVSRSYHGPAWLRKLMGGTDRLTVCWHVSEASINHGDVKTEDQLRLLNDLPHLSRVRVKVDGHESFDAANVMRLLRRGQHLSKIELEGLVFLEDIKAIATLPQLREINVDSAAMTVAELSGLRKRFPQIEFVEQELTRKKRAEWWTPTGVCLARIECWSGDAELDDAPHHGEYDLRHFAATADRLQLLGPLCEKAREVAFGEEVDTRAAVDFINACPGVGEVDFGGARFTPTIFKQLKPQNEYEIGIVLQQGGLSAEDFLDWVAGRNRGQVYFTVLGASFSPEEMQKLHDGFEELDARGRYFAIEAYATEADYEADRPLPGVADLPDREGTPPDPKDDPFGGDDPS